MRPDFLPSLLLSNTAHTMAATAQRRLSDAQIEASTGRSADVGLTLGSRTATNLRLRLELAEAAQSSEVVAQASAKASITQSVLASASDLANGFLQTLAGSRSADNGRTIAFAAAASGRDAFRDLINTTYEGQFLFSGLNTSRAPMADLGEDLNGPLSQKFESRFGFPPSDPLAGTISAEEMSDFLRNDLADLFAEQGWKAQWAGNVSPHQRQRIGSGAFVDASATATAQFVPKLAQALMIVSEFSKATLSQGAFQAMTDFSMTLVVDSQNDLGIEQSRIGVGQGRFAQAKDALEQRTAGLTAAVNAMESIDPYEAANRVNQLMNQLETSYAITGRISRLTILSYI